MKPINPQDRPKVIGLSVAMVIVFGLLAKTILGMLGSKNPQAQPAPVAPPVVATNTSTPPTGAAPAGATPGTTVKPSLTSLNAIEMGGPTDPFRRVLPDPGKFSNQGAAPSISPSPKGGGLSGAFPNPNGGSVFPIGPGVQTKAVPLEPPLKLDGVVSDRENFAMVTVNGKTEMYRAGNKIARLFEVISIDEYGASFRGPGGVFRLEVGQEHSPAAAPATGPIGFGGGLLPGAGAG